MRSAGGTSLRRSISSIAAVLTAQLITREPSRSNRHPAEIDPLVSGITVSFWQKRFCADVSDLEAGSVVIERSQLQI